MQALKIAMNRIVPLTEVEWQQVEDCVFEKSIKKGKILLAEGETNRELYFIRKGLIRKYYLKDGVENIRQFFFENAFVNEMASFITGQPSNIYMEAMEDCDLFVFKKHDMERLYEYSPTFQKMSRLIIEFNFIGLTRRVEGLFLQSPEERYLQLIQTRPKIFQRVPQYMIASYLDLTPEGLSRIKRRIAKQRNHKP